MAFFLITGRRYTGTSCLFFKEIKRTNEQVSRKKSQTSILILLLRQRAVKMTHPGISHSGDFSILA